MPGRTRLTVAALVVMITCVAASSTAAAPVRTRGPASLVGIIDTGIDPAALGDVIDGRASASLVPGEPIDDVDGHGTEMAWIVHRIAPAARLIIVKAVDADGSTTDQRLAAAIDRLRATGADVVLISLAGAEPLPRTRRAIAAAGKAGMLVIAAAGNDGIDLDRSRSYPGGYRLPNLITVAAVGGNGHLLGSSNRGGPTSVLAPGVVPTCSLDGRPKTSIGTSAAAAVAAGHAAAGHQGRVDPKRPAQLIARSGAPGCR